MYIDPQLRAGSPGLLALAPLRDILRVGRLRTPAPNPGILERHMEQKGDVGSVVILMFVLAFAVVIIDERWLRVLVAVVPALLLAQRALSAPVGAGQDRVGAVERRMDDETRSAVDELLRHIREFYLTCHLIGSGRISADEAVEEASKKERDLNRLLARVTDRARSSAS